MKIPRSAAASLGAYTLSAMLVHGVAVLEFEDIKNFKMVGPEESVYEGGSWNILMEDGVITFLPCGITFVENGNNFIAGSLFFIPPTVGCAAGTTALITVGDANGDGVRDQGAYFSITQPIPAANVEPFQTGLVELFSAPPSELPRPLGGFNWVDNSLVLFYDLVNDPVNSIGYEIARYESSRLYTENELERHRDEIVPGSYLFNFPALGSDEDNPRSFTINAPHREMVEAFPGPGGRDVVSGGISVGNDFRLTNDDRWNNGVMEIDPRLVFDFQWEGFNPQTFLNGDRLFFAVRDRVTDEIRFPPVPAVDPLGNPTGNPQLPQLIASSDLGIATGYELGPDFFEPNQEFVVELEFRRNLASGNTIDISRRVFRWDVNLIDTYEGFQRVSFPAGTLDTLIVPSADYDGDGFTNLQEFGLQTDVVDPASVPNPTPTLDPFTNQCLLEIEKRPGVGSRLTYIVEYSFDLETWTQILPNDPNWFIVFDNDELFSVLSREPVSVNPCFTRVRFTQN